MRKIDISDDVELANGKSLPGGWSQYKIIYRHELIGWLESGYPCSFKEGYSAELKEEGKNEDGKNVTRCIIYKHICDEELEKMQDDSYEIEKKWREKSK